MITTRKTVLAQAKAMHRARKVEKLIRDEISRLVLSGALPIGDGKTDNTAMANTVLYVAIKNTAGHFRPISEDLAQLATNLENF